MAVSYTCVHCVVGNGKKCSGLWLHAACRDCMLSHFRFVRTDNKARPKLVGTRNEPAFLVPGTSFPFAGRGRARSKSGTTAELDLEETPTVPGRIEAESLVNPTLVRLHREFASEGLGTA
jgi:hypothetical protein